MKGASKIPSEEEESRQSTSSDVAIFQDSHDDEGVEDNMLSDLDKLYIALCEVDEAHLFDMFCYSLNIKSLNALKEYNSRPAILVDPYEIDAVKEKLANKDFDFKVLTNKKYERSGLVETCKIKHIPIIEMKDIAVTGTITEGPYVGMVCQALWTKPDGSKVEVCLRYKTDHGQNFLREAVMANILRHRNILALYGVVIASSYSPSLALVVEFANYGNLEESFSHHTVERLCKFAIQAATALEHLEKKEVIHQWVTVFTCLVVADCQVNTVGELFVDLFPLSILFEV